MVTRSVTRSVTQPVAIPFALAGRSMLRLPYRGASLSLAFDSQQYAMGAIGKRPAAFAFSDLITFTRASGGGRFNAAGQYEWLAADQPRFDFDPVTGEAKGLLIEEQRTNLLRYSSDFTNLAWSKLTDLAVDANTAIAPDGTATACRIREILARTGDRLVQNISDSVNKNFTGSLFIKGEGEEIGKTVVFILKRYSSGVYIGVNVTITLTGEWQRVSQSLTLLAEHSGVSFTLVSSGTANSCLLWGAQLEAGSFPTSYIPTTTAQVTRAASSAIISA